MKKDIRDIAKSLTSEVQGSSFYQLSDIESLKDFAARDYGLEMQPDFQRSICWTDEQCSKFLEAIFEERKLNLDVYFNCGFYEGNVKRPSYCVDGLQRITAIERFLKDEINVFGYKCSQLTGVKSVRYGVYIHFNKLDSYKDVLRWYIELNDTGVAHTEEELDKVRELIEKD